MTYHHQVLISATTIFLHIWDSLAPQEGWSSGVRSHVHDHGLMFESWRVPCGGGGDFHGMHCTPHSDSLGVLG